MGVNGKKVLIEKEGEVKIKIFEILCMALNFVVQLVL